MSTHRCREGELVGMDMQGRYPRVTSHCSVCRRVIRRIPLDDVPQAWNSVVYDMIEFMRNRGRRRGL